MIEKDAKHVLRRHCRTVRRGLTPAFVQDASLRIRRRVISLLPPGAHVATFWPMLDRAEVDLRRLTARQTWTWHLPFMEPSGEGFRRFLFGQPLTTSAHGFLQPTHAAPLSAHLDWLIVPALAASANGDRLGYGAGFYDKALGRFRTAQSIVVVFEGQIMSVPTEPHDQPCEWVVTESHTRPGRRRRGG